MQPIDQIPADVLAICKVLSGSGYAAYLVGGAVRDLLAGRLDSGTDWDIATSATPEQVMGLYTRSLPTGVKHGTVTVVWSEHRKCEVTTFRGETRYSDGRHPDGVTFLTDIRADLARRDFTVNAIALDPGTGEVLDPWSGIADLGAGVLRAVGDPMERFREDGLRPMRAARFVAVLGLAPAEGLAEAMEATRDIFAGVSAERKRDEIIKMMSATAPSAGWRLLGRAGYVPLLFPGLERTIGCGQGGRHVHDVWEHSLACVDACRGPWQLRVAALLHDAGKPGTLEPRPDGAGMRFFEHEVSGQALAQAWLRDLHFASADAGRIANLVRHHMVIYSPGWSDAAIRRFLRRVGPENVFDVVDLALADVKAQGRSDDLVPLALELRARVEAQLAGGAALKRTALAVDGNDVMQHLGLEPGPGIGRILDSLLDAVTDDPAMNVRPRLLELAHRSWQAGLDPGSGKG